MPDARCGSWTTRSASSIARGPILAPEDASNWTVVAEGVVNRTLDEPAFTLDAAGRTIAVEFHVNPDLAHRPQATQVVEASLTGRNTSFGYPVQLCETLPDPLI